MSQVVMNSKDAVSGSLAECYATIDGSRYLLMQAVDLEATMEKSKTKVAVLGKTGKGNRSTGWEGKGKMKMHYNTSIFRELLYKYQSTGQDFYFDIQVTNEDPTSAVGRQTTILKGCNLDGGTLAKFDANADFLDEEVNFTFESWEMPETFSVLSGMQ